MAKIISPADLAEIVTGLLIDPTIFGELDERATATAFAHDIANVIADYCGGQVVEMEDDERGLTHGSFTHSPVVAIAPCEALGTKASSPWVYYDPQGWSEDDFEEHCPDIEDALPIPRENLQAVRTKLRSLLANTAVETGQDIQLRYKMVDWMYQEAGAVEVTGDDAPYDVALNIGNQISFECTRGEDEYLFAILEINKGVPGLHLSPSMDEQLLHIHSTDSGLVMTPDQPDDRFEAAAPTRHSYHSNNALLIN